MLSTTVRKCRKVTKDMQIFKHFTLSLHFYIDIKMCLSLHQLANVCYMERIDLSAHGFYITPDIGFDWKIGQGKPFSYFTYGAAFAEVEIDTLTGDFHTRTADVCLDLGFSINPALDVGQVLFCTLVTALIRFKFII